MKADEEGLPGSGVSFDHIDGAGAQQIGQVAGPADFDVALPQIIGVGHRRAGFVREVIDRAAAETIEIVVAALQRTEIGQPPQMPFADQRGLVAGLLQERRQGRMVRRQTDLARHARAQRLFEPDRQPVLVTPGNQRDAGGGADCRIGIGLGEAHALGGDAIDIGRGEIAAAVAGNIGIAEIVGENEQNVRSG
jgi:hypothetical protein